MKKYLVTFLVLVLLFLNSFANYPTKAVTIICPWSAGGGSDRIVRLIANELEEEFGKPFVVLNKPGGGGAVGHTAGAYAKPDGYTLTFVTQELATLHWLGFAKVNYENFEYIIQVNEDPAGVVVRKDAPWHTINDLLEDIKVNPGKYKFSGSGPASVWDLSRVGMLDKAGISPSNVLWVPTDGAAPALVELLGGHVDVITCSIAEVSPQIKAGEVRALAVMSDERLSEFPEVPTLKEQGIDWSSGTWRGLAAPKGTSKEIINIIYQKMLKVVNKENFIDFMEKNGFGIKIRDPESFFEFVKKEDSEWKYLLQLGGYI
jgi:tripartite-type tricarboxylate transporter receptor subunit TctC